MTKLGVFGAAALFPCCQGPQWHSTASRALPPTPKQLSARTTNREIPIAGRRITSLGAGIEPAGAGTIAGSAGPVAAKSARTAASLPTAGDLIDIGLSKLGRLRTRSATQL